jgi:HD superfamily phosphodiesterase
MRLLPYVYHSLRLVKQLSSYYRIDQSHNEHHSREVLFWCNDLLQSERKTYPFSYIKIIAQSAILHDMIDHKYSTEPSKIWDYLRTVNTPQETTVVMNIMSTMSYSKTLVDGVVRFPDWIRQDKEYENAYHIVRQADLLSSYNLARMVEYRQARNVSEPLIREEVVDMYKNRMARLVEHGLFVTGHAKERAGQLDAVTRLKLDAVAVMPLDHLGFLRNVDYVNVEDVVRQMSMWIEED